MHLNIEEQYDKIYRYCYLRVQSKEIAEDLTQETFLHFLEHPQYHSTDKSLNLLYTIARNLCIDEFRKDKPPPIPEDTASDEDLEGDLLTELSLKEALASLSQEDREIILLRYINDVPTTVISNLYNVSRFAMNRRIKRILNDLQNVMGKEELYEKT